MIYFNKINLCVKEKEGGGVVIVVIYVFIKNMMVYRDVLFCLCGCLVFLRLLLFYN